MTATSFAPALAGPRRCMLHSAGPSGSSLPGMAETPATFEAVSARVPRASRRSTARRGHLGAGPGEHCQIDHRDHLAAVGEDAQQVGRGAGHAGELGEADHLGRALGGHGVPALARAEDEVRLALLGHARTGVFSTAAAAHRSRVLSGAW